MHPQIQSLLNHAATATPFVSTSGQAFVSLPLGTFSHQVCSVLSPRFRDWLVDAFFREHNEPPSPYALRQTIRTLEARANSSGPTLQLNRRVAARGNPHHPDAILLDLANPAGEIVEITAQGWQLSTDPTAAFLHSRGNTELPSPQSQAPSPQPQAILAAHLNVTPSGLNRILVWLLASLRPQGPHPILILDGPPNSGKSTAARMLRALIDPSLAPLHSLPHSEPELLALAQHNWILAFHHAGRIRQPISDTLCRLASGTALRYKEKGDHRESLSIQLHRPILIATTPAWNPDESLSEKTLTVRLAALTPLNRRTEADLWQDFEALRPAILSSLCTAMSTALSAKRTCHQSPSTNHANAAQWAIAAIPTNRQAILDALNENPTTPILESITALMNRTPQWSGTATDLLYEIAVSAVTAPVLSHHLRRHKNNLESRDITVTFARHHRGIRTITLTTSPHTSHQPPATNHQPPATAAGAAYNKVNG